MALLVYERETCVGAGTSCMKVRLVRPRCFVSTIGTFSTESFHGDGDVGGRKRLGRGRRCSRQKCKPLAHFIFPTATCRISRLVERYFCLAMQTTTFRTKNLFRYTTVIVIAFPMPYIFPQCSIANKEAFVMVWRNCVCC